MKYLNDRIYSGEWHVQYKQDWLQEYLPKISDCLTDNIGCADRLYIKDKVVLMKDAKDIASVFGNAVSHAFESVKKIKSILKHLVLDRLIEN